MALDIQKLFNQDLPARIAANPAAFAQIGHTFQVHIAGVGDWFINATAANPHVEAGSQSADADFTFGAETPFLKSRCG